MQYMPDNLYTLKRRIDEAEQSSEIVSVLEVLAPLLAENTSSRELYNLLSDAFQALRALTSEQVSDGEHLILTYLLDYLERTAMGLQSKKARPGNYVSAWKH